MNGSTPNTAGSAQTAPASLALRSAQRAFAALIEEHADAGEFRAAQLRAGAARSLSALSADDRWPLARWLALEIATLDRHDGAAVLGALARLDAWLAACMRREVPALADALRSRGRSVGNIAAGIGAAR